MNLPDNIFSRQIFSTYALIIIGCLYMTACSQTSSQPFRIGSDQWPGYEPLFLARNNKYFDDSIRLVEYPNATEVLRAFRNRSLEAACLTLDEALLLRQYDLPVTIILVTDISDGADAIIARRGISSMQQLVGKTIAVESSALGAYVISRALEKNNMSLQQINIRHLGVDQHSFVFNNPDIDAVVTYEPMRTRLLAQGAEEIFSSAEIPGEIVDVMVINNEFVDNHRAQVRAVIRGWFHALQDLKDKPQQSAEVISRRQKISPEQVLASYQGMKQPSLQENRKLLGGEKPGLVTHIEILKKVMENEQLLQPDVSINDLLSDQFLTIDK